MPRIILSGKVSRGTGVDFKNIVQIKKISNKESWCDKIFHHLKTFVFAQAGQNISIKYVLAEVFNEKPPNLSRFKLQTQRAKEFLFKLIQRLFYPNESHYYHQITTFAESCEEIFNDKSFVDFLITRRSEAVLKILQYDILEERSRSVLFYRAIMNINSFIYKEFKYSNFDNGVTKYLFENPKICEGAGLWRPVGEAVIDYLDELAKLEKSEDRYNGTMVNFDSHDTINERVKSPIYVGIHFFREMIHTAFTAQIKWHMWLYYYEHFLTRIVQNISPHNPGDREFPSRYHFLIYELLNAMTDLLNKISRDPEKTKLLSATIEKVDLNHDNGSIIKSAMKCLGKCTEIILDARNLTEYDKKYFLDVIFHSYFKLTEDEKLKRYAEQYLLFIKYGGGLGSQLLKPEFIIEYLKNSDFKLHPNSFDKVQDVIDHYYDSKV